MKWLQLEQKQTMQPTGPIPLDTKYKQAFSSMEKQRIIFFLIYLRLIIILYENAGSLRET